MQEDDDYLKFVMDTLKTYKDYSDRLLSDDKEILPQDVQYLLAIYQSAKFGLLAETQRRLRVLKRLQRQYNIWWNAKVAEARKTLLSTTPGKKFPALKEYSIKAQEDAGDEFNIKQEEIADAEDKYEFMQGLKKDWDSFQFILQILNSNMVSELRSLNIDRLPSQPRTREKK